MEMRGEITYNLPLYVLIEKRERESKRCEIGERDGERERERESNMILDRIGDREERKGEHELNDNSLLYYTCSPIWLQQRQLHTITLSSVVFF